MSKFGRGKSTNAVVGYPLHEKKFRLSLSRRQGMHRHLLGRPAPEQLGPGERVCACAWTMCLALRNLASAAWPLPSPSSPCPLTANTCMVGGWHRGCVVVIAPAITPHRVRLRALQRVAEWSRLLVLALPKTLDSTVRSSPAAVPFEARLAQ